jgi:hypothetical protein
VPGHYASFAYSDPFADEASLSLLGGRILDDSEDDTEQEEGGPPKLTTAQLARLRELVKNMPRFYGADESGMTAAGSTDPSGMEGADVEAAYTNYFEELKAYNATINQFLEDEGIPRFYKDDKGDTYYLNIGDPGQPSSFTDMYWTGEYDPQQKPGNYIQEGAVGLYGTRFDEIAEFNESQFAAGLKTVAAAVVGQQLGGLLGDALGGLVGAEAGGASVGVSLGSFEGEDEDVLSEEGINPYLAYLTGKTLSEEKDEEEEDTTTVDATQGFLNTLNTAEEALQTADDEVTTATEALQESNESYDETIANYQKRLEDEKRRYGSFRARNMPYYKRLEKLKKQAEIDKQTEATKLRQTIAAAQTERDNARKAASYAEREYNESVKLKQAADQRQAEQDARDRIMGEKAAADYLKELRDSISAAQAETVETAEVDIPVTAPEVVEEIEEDITLQIPEPLQETVTESEQEAEEEAEQAAEAVISEAAPQDIQTQAEVSEGAPSEDITQDPTVVDQGNIVERQLEELIEAEKEAGNDELAAALESELENYSEGKDDSVQQAENIFESEDSEDPLEAGEDPVNVTSILLGTVPNLSTAGEISEEPTEELFTQGQVDDFMQTAEQSFENKLAEQLAEQQEEFEEKQAEEAAEAAEAVEQATAQGREEGFGEGFGEGQGQGRGEGAGAGLGAGLGLGLGIGLLRPGGVTQSLFENFEFKPAYQAPELLDPLPEVETPNFLQGLFRDVA